MSEQWTENVGSLLEISRNEISADFEWRIPISETVRLQRGDWNDSPFFYFVGWRWWMELERGDPNSVNDVLVLKLCRSDALSPDPLVRYWLGTGRSDGGREEEEIARGTMESGHMLSIYHPWLRFSELRRRLGRSAPSSGTITIFIRLRSGPETEDEMKSLVEGEVSA